MKKITKKTKKKNNYSSSKAIIKKAPKINSSKLWLCGKHPVFSVIKEKRRQIFEILANKNSILELEEFLQKNGANDLKHLIKLCDNRKIEEAVGENHIHQGLAILCSKLDEKNQNDLLEELYRLKEKTQKLPPLLMLDQISDPHNIGAIIRSASAFGVTKIILCEHNAPSENATIAKSSSGTIELIDLIKVTNFNLLIEKLKKIGYWCLGLAGEAKEDISQVRNYENIALIIGSEGNGIRKLVKKNCDLLVKINIDENVESLNASTASAIALYELSKKL